MIAREILHSIKVEIMASREGLTVFEPVVMIEEPQPMQEAAE